jgi:hypothetical protein
MLLADNGWVSNMLQTSAFARIALMVFIGMTAAGCEVIGGIFKAGVWVGALAVIAVAVLIVVVIAKMKG